MAAVHLVVTDADTATPPTATDSFTPTVGRLQVVFVSFPDTVDNTATITNSEGMTYTLAQVALRGGSSHRLFCYVADAATVSGASQTITVDTPADPATGSLAIVYELEGVDGVGLSAVRQVIARDNQTTGSNATPDITFAGSCLTGNPTIAVIANATNTTSLDAPSGWTESADLGIATTPNAGFFGCFRNSGFTGTLIDWDPQTSATAWAGIAIEFNAAAAGGAKKRRTGLMGVG